MQPIDRDTSPNSLAIASIAIISSLIESLVINKVINKGDVANVIDAAKWAIDSRSVDVDNREAVEFLQTLRDNWS
jgi:hypothetical protein